MRKLISVLTLLLFAVPAFAIPVGVPEIDGANATIGIALLVGVLGLVKERSRRK